MSEILKGKLFLENVLNVNRLNWLNQKNIQTIICVASTKDVVITDAVRISKTLHQFDIMDNTTQHLDFGPVVQLIQESMENGAVLVNCAVGQSRSPAFVIAYLISANHMTLREAYRHVKSVRPKINPNSFFMEQLVEWERSIWGEVENNL